MTFCISRCDRQKCACMIFEHQRLEASTLPTTCVVFYETAVAEIGLTVWGRHTSSEITSSSVLMSMPSSGRPTVSYVAHLTGALAGLVTGLLVLGPASRRRTAAVDHRACSIHRHRLTGFVRSDGDRKEQYRWA
jgi:Rhomboid family